MTAVNLSTTAARLIEQLEVARIGENTEERTLFVMALLTCRPVLVLSKYVRENLVRFLAGTIGGVRLPEFGSCHSDELRDDRSIVVAHKFDLLPRQIALKLTGYGFFTVAVSANDHGRLYQDEAILDQFAICLNLDPFAFKPDYVPARVLEYEELLSIRKKIYRIESGADVKEYIFRLIQATRPDEENQLGLQLFLRGASNFGCLDIYRLACARAAINGRHHVTVHDVQSVYVAAMCHRVQSFDNSVRTARLALRTVLERLELSSC